MSFILDALKKSEAERQRQAGPTLLELRITRPRRRYPLWSWLVGALLAANAAVLLTFLVRRPVAAPAGRLGSVTAAAPAAGAAASAAPVGPVPATPTPAAIARPVPAAQAGEATTAAPSQHDVAQTRIPPLAAQPAQGAAARGSARRNPADYEPALPATHAAQPGAADYSSLPSLSQIGGNIPSMQLDLLDYSALSSERYALINMHRVREGDALPDGAKVLAITPNGVAMDYRGQQFLLRPGGTAR